MHGGVWTNTNNGGPGQTLSTYLPKADDIQQKLADSLEPAVAENPQKGKDKGKGKGKGKPNQRMGLRVKEKDWTHLYGGGKENSIMEPASRWQHSPTM